MFKIVKKEKLSKDINRMSVQAPLIAAKAEAGQFVVVVIDQKSERIPLTLADWDKDKGEITLIFQEVGFSTRRLGALNAGDSVLHLLGPLGHPTKTADKGTVVCIGGGVGIAEVLPVSRAFKKAGSRVLGIIGARCKELLILEKEMQDVCDELFITTDDGSYVRRGFVTDVLKELLGVMEKSTHTKYPDLVYAIGPVPMMRAVSELTREYDISTIVSLNPVMVDATGMCGSCRCQVDGKTVFGCVDGPDFNGHKVDFAGLEKRLQLFKEQERYIQDRLGST
jgi:ferredoxin--NADP+ reductase